MKHNTGLVDFHTHILPGMDDGSRNTEQTECLLQAQREQGVETILLMPHFYPTREDLHSFLKRREKAMTKMPVCDDIQFILGAEVHYSNGMSQWSSLKELSWGDGYILVEMPSPPWSAHMYRELESIKREQNLTPVLAHIDRYVHPLCTFGMIKRLAQLPVLVQANSSFFLNPWTRHMALRLLKVGRIHLLGSDCHNMDRRPPNVKAAYEIIERHLGKETRERLEHFSRLIVSSGAYTKQ